jgi:hypothetical protein
MGASWEHRRPGSPCEASPPIIGWPAGASGEYGAPGQPRGRRRP